MNIVYIVFSRMFVYESITISPELSGKAEAKLTFTAVIVYFVYSDRCYCWPCRWNWPPLLLLCVSEPLQVRTLFIKPFDQSSLPPQLNSYPEIGLRRHHIDQALEPSPSVSCLCVANVHWCSNSYRFFTIFTFGTWLYSLTHREFI